MKNFLHYIKNRITNGTPPVLSSLQSYALWAESYPAEAHNVLMQIEQTSMESLLPDLSGKTVLDLACGSGRYARLATAYGAQTVTGIDNSQAMLAQADIPSRICATTEAIPLQSASIDIILCGLALGHLPQLELSIKEISRVLKPGGIVLISDFHPFQFMSGARRTFQSGGRTFAVEHYVHYISTYFQVAKQSQLTVIAIQEPLYNEVPVVLVLAFHKS